MSLFTSAAFTMTAGSSLTLRADKDGGACEASDEGGRGNSGRWGVSGREEASKRARERGCLDEDRSSNQPIS